MTATDTTPARTPGTADRAADRTPDRPADRSPDRRPPPRWAVLAAHLTTWVVLPSSVWRILLALGHPAGYTDTGFEDFRSVQAKLVMVALSVLSELAAFLTLGLVRPWGEVLPRWIPVLGGRRVHPMAAVVPAGLGAVALTGLWCTVPLWWTFPHADMTPTGNLVVGLLYQPLFLWGPLLAAVTVSYHRRHSGRTPDTT
ncbi:hypothetical protein [Streptomyces sp. NPDC012888]|uniref:hypothetical protein n=1 Tax=Streptomyces sp. NPDC012888 TaxID=3364855 RepID=UPI003677776C